MFSFYHNNTISLATSTDSIAASQPHMETAVPKRKRQIEDNRELKRCRTSTTPKSWSSLSTVKNTNEFITLNDVEMVDVNDINQSTALQKPNAATDGMALMLSMFASMSISTDDLNDVEMVDVSDDVNHFQINDIEMVDVNNWIEVY